MMLILARGSPNAFQFLSTNDISDPFTMTQVTLKQCNFALGFVCLRASRHLSNPDRNRGNNVIQWARLLG